jgi:hypothetical protein
MNKNRKPKKRLVIYDFDGTIFNSPDREKGELTYFNSTGEKLPFSGWWGRLESLSPPIVPEKPDEKWLIANTIAAYREDFKNDETELVLMTGRPFKNSKRIIDICQHFELMFHLHYFRGQPGQKGKDTLEIKCNFITEELIHEKLEILEIWEDRPEHTAAFFESAKQWKKTFGLNKIIIHDVFREIKHVV